MIMMKKRKTKEIERVYDMYINKTNEMRK